ncbi:MAG: hypothetical protein RLZZ531_1038 [Bacteroidota bacterium]|jgi:hypothetical protein
MNRIFIILVLGLYYANEMHAQLAIKEPDFNSKNIFKSIFRGQFLEESKIQKWPMSQTQAFEMSSYVDANHFAYSSIDSILDLKIDSNEFKIVVFKTYPVDSTGAIQEYMAAIPKIGLAFYLKQNGVYQLESFKLTVINGYHNLISTDYRLEFIGPSIVAIVLKEETHQDLGKEFWVDLSNDFKTFLSYDYLSLLQGEKTSLIENSIEIIKTENEYYDFILNSKITPSDLLDSEKASKIKPVKTKLIFNNTDMMQHVQIPFGYSIQQKINN